MIVAPSEFAVFILLILEWCESDDSLTLSRTVSVTSSGLDSRECLTVGCCLRTVTN